MPQRQAPGSDALKEEGEEKLGQPMQRVSKSARVVKIPLSDEVVEALHAGEELLLSGVMYVGARRGP